MRAVSSFLKFQPIIAYQDERAGGVEDLEGGGEGGLLGFGAGRRRSGEERLLGGGGAQVQLRENRAGFFSSFNFVLCLFLDLIGLGISLIYEL